MSFRRLLAGLALLAVVIVAAVLLTPGDKPEGTTERGLPGFPVRGSLASDTKAIDGAVAAWRDEIAEDAAKAEGDDDRQDAAERARAARRPDEDDDISALWIGRVNHNEDVAILESGGLAALVKRDDGLKSWFLSAERLRDEDFRGEFPIAVGDSILVPEGAPWRYVDASFSSGYKAVGDGLFREDGVSPDGFLLPQPAGPLVPIHITGVGGRAIRREDYGRFVAALERGYGRSIWLAANEAQNAIAEDDAVRRPGNPPPLALVWTGAVPDYAHAAVLLQGNSYSGPRVATLGYGQTPGPEDRTEEKDEGAVRLGTARADQRNRPKQTFAAGTYTEFHDVPYLVLAGSGDVDSLHALVGGDEVTRKAPLAVIDARRFESDDFADTVVFGRTAAGQVVAPFEKR